MAARATAGNARTGRTQPDRGRTKDHPATARGQRSSRSRSAADQAVAANDLHLTLPIVGPVSLPAPQHLAWYAGVATLTIAGLLEWPVALVIAVGHLLGEDHHNRLIEDFGSALEQA
ncbi:MAG: hypothetical protein ACRDP8_22910 [Actinopolymorphaceae bacterium]